MKKLNIKNIKDKLDEDNLDLSICDLKEVPVKEIAELQKARKLNLSYNNLIYLPVDFIKLQNIREIDLSNNHLKALPKNFGCLINLKRLDLFKNDLEELPLSFCDLKSLQWLDLKDNPLEPQLQKVAGDCLDEAQCKKCAINVLKYMKQLKVNDDRRQQEIQKIKAEEEQRRKLVEEKEKEIERQKLKELKKQEKELKKQEYLRKLEFEKQQREQRRDENNELTNENDVNNVNNASKRRNKGKFIFKLLNFIFFISLFSLLGYFLLSFYCETYATSKVKESKTSNSESTLLQVKAQIIQQLDSVCRTPFMKNNQINHWVIYVKKLLNIS